MIGLFVAIPALHLGLQFSGMLGKNALAVMPYVMWAGTGLLAGVRSLMAARRAYRRAQQIAWVWFGWGAIAWSIGIGLELISLYWVDPYELLIGTRRFFYLVYPVTLVAGLFVLASSRSRSLGILNLANIGVIGAATLACAILILLEPVLKTEESAAYVVFSIIDLTSLFTATIVALHLLWFQGSREIRGVVLLLALSASVHAAANIGYYVDQFQFGSYESNLDVFWLFALLLHYWAAHEQDASTKLVITASQTGWIERSAGAAQVLLPAVLIIAVAILAIYFTENLTVTVTKTLLFPMFMFAVFLGLREFALDRHQKRLVEELHESNTLNTHVLRASPGVVVICEAREGFAVTYISENGRIQFGLDVSNFDFSKHIHPEDRQTVSDALHKALATGVSNSEFRIRNQKGDWRWVDQRFILRHDAVGKPTELIGALLDITERKELQMSTAQAQRLESLGRLSGSIAHDFNNLLTAILGFSELLLYKNTLKDSERDKISEIKYAAERGAALTRQLLTFSRRHAVSTEVVDVNGLVTNMRDMLDRLLSDNADLEFRLCAEPLNTECNRNQLEQVVMNLILNASEAMPDGGRILVSTSRAIPNFPANHDADRQKEYGMISIQDTGIGMDKEVQSQIFDPFFTTKADGSGLGLATAHGIVRQLGGYIEVNSWRGQGTQFDIFLPLTDRVEEAAKEVQRSSVQTGTESILVIDDEESITRVIARALTPMGYTVFTANDADEAIRIANEQSFHLVLSDVIMPDCNGYELVGRLRLIRPDFKVIYMSGYTGDVLAAKQLRDENASLVQKPLGLAQLSAEIRRHLDESDTGDSSGN